MENKKRNCTINKIKIFLVILTISVILIPLVLKSISFNSDALIYDSHLKTGDFSKDDYNPILTDEKHSLGNITINDIDFSELEMGFNIYNDTYPLIWGDYNSSALNMTQIDIQFIETTEPAIVDNLNENVEDRKKVTVKLNESIFVEYNNLTLGYLIYHPRLNPSRLLELYIDNNTDIIELDAETDYIIDNDGFLVFNYDKYFQKGPLFNFSMYFIWEYDLSIGSWSLTQVSITDLIMSEKAQNFTVKYRYNFTLAGKKFGQTINEQNIYVDNIDVALTINLPDKNLLNDHVLELKGAVVSNHLNINKSIEIVLADQFSAGQSKFSLNFTTLFRLKFVDPVGDTWAIDRLVAKRNIREKIYFPSLINGPPHIYLKHISFYEPTIYFDQLIEDRYGQLIGNYSLFERTIALFELNVSLTGREGMRVKIPYLFVGETCPFIIKYEATQNLRIIITDNIKMPLVGASVEVYYSGQKFGTYISNEQVQPIPPGMTNEYGEILLNDVPHGNFTIQVYYNGVFLKESNVSTYNNINYIYTEYPHFPVWILIFGIINGIILIIGLGFYLKYKKMR